MIAPDLHRNRNQDGMPERVKAGWLATRSRRHRAPVAAGDQRGDRRGAARAGVAWNTSSTNCICAMLFFVAFRGW